MKFGLDKIQCRDAVRQLLQCHFCRLFAHTPNDLQVDYSTVSVVPTSVHVHNIIIILCIGNGTSENDMMRGNGILQHFDRDRCQRIDGRTS
jgi:hypothetical protein